MTEQAAESQPEHHAKAVFVSGSTLRHVITMTLAGAIGLVSVFAVDVLNLFYVSTLGDQALTAAVGYASTIMFFTVSTSIGFTISATALVSRELGTGNLHDARIKAGSSLVFVLSLNGFFAIVLYPMLPTILTLLGATGKSHQVALDFMQIVAFSIPLLGVGMCSSGLLRAIGDAKRAMFVTLSAGITAAIFDPIFIIYLDLGIRGAAITTFITRIVLTLIGLYGIGYVHKMIAIPSRSQLLKLVKPFLVIAVPAVLTQIATPFSNAYMTAMMSEFGDGAVAGWAIIGRLVPLAFVAIFTLSAAVGPILGQNLGAKRYDRLNSTMWDSLKFAFVYTLFTWALLAIFADQIIFVFDATNEAAALVKFFSLVIGGTYLFQAGLFVANAAFNNLGYPLLSTFFNWGRATLGTIPFVWIGSHWGANGALAGFGIGGILFGITAILVCFRVIRQLSKKDRIDQKL